MQRFSTVVVGLVVLALCAGVAWWVVSSFDDELGDPSENGTAVVDDGRGTEDGAAAVDDAGRRRVADAGDDAPIPEEARSIGGVVRMIDGTPIGGATVELYAVPSDTPSAEFAAMRNMMGDIFSDEELEQMQRSGGNFMNMSGMGPGEEEEGGEEEEAETSAEEDAATADEDDAGSVIEVGGFEIEEDDMETAMDAGMSIAARMFSEEGMIDRVIGAVQMQLAELVPLADLPRMGSTKTDSEGKFAFENMPAGDYELRVRAARYVREVSRRSAGDDDVVVVLSRGAEFQGSVVSVGQAIAGATVQMRTATVTTDGGGRFAVDGAVTPRDSILVSAPGFVSHARYVDISLEGPNEPVVIELQPAATVRGVVLDVDGAPIAGAGIRLSSGDANPMAFMRLMNQENLDAPLPAATTNADGYFELDGIKPGTWKLVASASGFLPATTESMPLEGGQTVDDIELVMSRESVLVGRILSQDGLPVEGALVKVEGDAPGGMGAMIANMMGGTWSTATTDADGRYRVGRLEAGTRNVRVEARGYLHLEDEVDVPDGGESTFETKLEEGYTISGFVYAPDGSTVSGAKVAIDWPDEGAGMAAMMGMSSGGDATAKTAEDGSFTAIGLQEGPYSVTASAPDYIDVTVDDIEQGAENVALNLRAAATLSGIVISQSTGEPVSGAWVIRSGGASRGGNPWMAMMRQDPRELTDAEGRFTMTGLEPGRYKLIAEREGYADSEKLRVECAEGEVVDGIELGLRPGENLEGRVVDKGTNAPVSGAVVWVSKAANPMAGFNMADFTGGDPEAPPGAIEARTDDDGRFVLQGLTPGKVTVEVRARDYAPATRTRIEVPGAEITVTISTGGIVEGVALDANGQPRVGVQIMLMGGAMGMGTQRSATTDAEGHYRIERLLPGTYQLMLAGTSSGFGFDGATPVTVRDGETTTHDFKDKGDGKVVSGAVVKDGVPLEGAMLVLSGGSIGMRMSQSDADGNFTFDDVPPGTYTVLVQGDIMGGGSTSQEVTVGEDGAVSDVRLELSSLSISGRAVDGETGKGVAGLQVVLMASGAKATGGLEDVMRVSRGQTFTDERGNFTLEGVERGTFDLRVSGGGYAAEVLTGISGGASDIVVRMTAGLELEVSVVDSNGEPVQNATVTSEDASGNETLAFDMTMSGNTNNEGITILRLAAGRHTLRAESSTHPSSSVAVDAAAGTVTITLADGGSVEVHVTKDGEPVPSARIRVLDGEGNEITKRLSLANLMGSGGVTDSAGIGVREGLPAGSVTIIVTTPDGTEARETATVVPGKTQRVDVRY